MSITLGVLSLVAGCVFVLALNDIFHGETDVRMEWAAMRVAALIILMFHAMALMTLSRVARGASVK